MGCWDIFCFICGNPCHQMSIDYINNIKKLKSYPNIINNLIDLEKNTRWMNKCSMLLTNDKIKHNMKEVSCNVTFCDNNNFCAKHMGKQISRDECSFIDNCGVFIHTDCWKFIKNTYNIELKFSNLPKIKYLQSSELKKLKDWNTIFDINYGDIKKYWRQYFEFVELVIDKKKYLCSSPLKNDKNIKQIKKNISALKIKNDSERIGPIVSATFYDEGDIKLGKNNFFWIKKNNKWLQINEKLIKIMVNIDITKLNNKQKKFIEHIPYIGQHNTNPIFIISSDNLKKNIYRLKLILSENYKNILIENIPK
jgi:hypothetical protein